MTLTTTMGRVVRKFASVADARNALAMDGLGLVAHVSGRVVVTTAHGSGEFTEREWAEGDPNNWEWVSDDNSEYRRERKDAMPERRPTLRLVRRSDDPEQRREGGVPAVRVPEDVL